MKRKAIVLGCGLAGATVARDLAADPEFKVAALDLNPDNLKKFNGLANITTVRANLADPAAIKEAVADFDIVVGALPGALGLQTLQAVIESGKNLCDMSYMEPDGSGFADCPRNALGLSTTRPPSPPPTSSKSTPAPHAWSKTARWSCDPPCPNPSSSTSPASAPWKHSTRTACAA